MNLELQILLLLAIIITACKLAGHVSARYLRQPAVFGEILVGLLLGPTLLNLYGWPIFRGSADTLHQIVNVLADLGVLLLMFVAGLETNVAQLRQVGNTAFWTAVCGVVLPFGAGAYIAHLFGLPLSEAIFVGAVLTATSVSISAQTLIEIGQLASRQGSTILGAAVIDDVLGIIVLSFVIAFGEPHAGASSGRANDLATSLSHLLGAAHPAIIQVLFVIVLMGLFFLLALLVGKYLSPLLAAAERLHASYIIPAAALVIIFLYAVGAAYIGQVAAITGAYLAGVFLAQTAQKEQIERALHPLTYALLVPVFFVSIGLNVNARALGGSFWFTLVIVLVAIITKVLGCGLGARFSGFTDRESIQVGFGMVSRGEVGLIVAQVGFAAGVIGKPAYAAMIMVVLVSTMITPILLRAVFPGKIVED